MSFRDAGRELVGCKGRGGGGGMSKKNLKFIPEKNRTPFKSNVALSLNPCLLFCVFSFNPEMMNLKEGGKFLRAAKFLPRVSEIPIHALTLIFSGEIF